MNWIGFVATIVSVALMLYLAWTQIDRLGSRGRYFRPLFFVVAPLILITCGVLAISIAVDF